MPTYQYECLDQLCGNSFEERREFGDFSDATCPSCGSPAERVFDCSGVEIHAEFSRTDDFNSDVMRGLRNRTLKAEDVPEHPEHRAMREKREKKIKQKSRENWELLKNRIEKDHRETLNDLNRTQ